MNLKKIKSNLNPKIIGLIMDLDSGVVFNPNSSNSILISNNAHDDGREFIFNSRRRGFSGYYYLDTWQVEECTNEEVLLFKEFLKGIKFCKVCKTYHEVLKEEDICEQCCRLGYHKCVICGKIETNYYNVDKMEGLMCHQCVENLPNKHCKCDNCMTYYDITIEGNYNHDLGRCKDCENRTLSHRIRKYHSNPLLSFKKVDNNDSKLFFGFELEMDNGGYNHSNAIKIGKIVEDDIFFSTDGSLKDGFEMISQPMQYDYFMSRKDLYAKLFAKAIDLGYQSHTTTTCGLHFHMSRDYFTDCDITKLVYLFEKHWDNITLFTRRTTPKLNKWASRYGEYHNEEIIEERAHIEENKAKDKLQALAWNGRRKAINLKNKNTIEIRVFRGTLNINTFVASMQFLYHLVDMIKTKDFNELRVMSWSKLMFNTSYPELNDYLIIRGLVGDKIERSKKVVDK